MRRLNVVAVAAAVLGIASAAAAQGNLSPKARGAFTPVPRQSRPLFRNGPMDALKEDARRRLQPQRPKVVCGMSIAPANPEIDLKSIKPAPKDKKYTMRLVPAPMCGSDASTVVVPAPSDAPR